MTSKERMNIVLARGKADRVPVALVSDSDYECQAAGIDHREFRYGDSATRAEVQRRFWLRHEANDFLLVWSGVDRKWTARHKVTRQGDRWFVTYTDTGKTEEIEKWPTAANPRRAPTSQGYARCVTCEADIEKVLGPRQSADDLLAADLCAHLEMLTKSVGDRAFLAFPCGGVFPNAVNYLGGFESAMKAVATNPSLVRTLCEELAHRFTARIQVAARFKPDGIWQSAYLEGADMISPRHWRELVLPAHRILTAEAQRFGLKVLLWFLGDCMPLLDDIVGLGVDALVVEQPRRGYSSDPGEIRRRVGHRLCVYGWSPELAMIKGDREAITRTVEAQVRAAGLDGAFVMGSTYLTNEVSCETVDFFCNEVVRLSP